jgi:hypothetical protein
MDIQATVGPPQRVGGKAPAIIDVAMLKRGEERDFVMEFVEKSRESREPFREIWDEVLENYLVTFDSPRKASLAWNQRGTGIGWSALKPNPQFGSRLKDPETHQIVETLSAQAIGLLLGDPDYIQAIPIGADDPEKARLLSRLIMAALDDEGTFPVELVSLPGMFSIAIAHSSGA